MSYEGRDGCVEHDDDNDGCDNDGKKYNFTQNIP